MSHPEWPPPYKLKRHRLAKNVKLRTTARNGLEITVPFQFNADHLLPLLEENRQWIHKQLSRLDTLKEDTFPDELNLLAMNERWKIDYVVCQAGFKMIVRPDHHLVLTGSFNVKMAIKKISVWIRKRAHDFLLAEINDLGKKTGLTYSGLKVRNQNTLWGSCTAAQSIQLNFKLVFLPRELMRHVIIHELCHTEFLDHSPLFWNRVAELDKNWQLHKKALRQASQYIPSWLQIC